MNNLDINNPINNAEEQPKEEEQKQNEIESGPGILLNQPLGNTQVQEQNSGQ